jgi:hypothetical protein
MGEGLTGSAYMPHQTWKSTLEGCCKKCRKEGAGKLHNTVPVGNSSQTPARRYLPKLPNPCCSLYKVNIVMTKWMASGAFARQYSTSCANLALLGKAAKVNEMAWRAL